MADEGNICKTDLRCHDLSDREGSRGDGGGPLWEGGWHHSDGRISYDDYVVDSLKEMLSFIAPVEVMAGEYEMEALATELSVCWMDRKRLKNIPVSRYGADFRFWKSSRRR